MKARSSSSSTRSSWRSARRPTATSSCWRWTDSDEQDIPSVADILRGPVDEQPGKPARPGQVIIFTSGTTGLPKGAKREEPDGLDPTVTFFGAIPYRGNSTIVLASPLFHSWGLINFGFGLSTVPTFVMRRKF